MKKALIYGLSAALLLALVLVACNKPQADQPTEPDPTPSAVQTEPVETPAAEPTAKVDEAQPMTARTNLTQKELTEYFEAAYNAGQIYADLGYDEDSLIEQELKELSYFVEDGTAKWPDDVNVQYLTWRILNHSQEPEDLIDQNIINQGFEADVDLETGDIGYWNPNTEEDPLSEGLTESGSDYDEAHHIDPTQSSIFTIPDDPWEGSAHIKYGGSGG